MHRILVVEDNLSLAQCLCIELETEGFAAETKPDGSQALERLRQQEPSGVQAFIDEHIRKVGPLARGVQTLSTAGLSDPLTALRMMATMAAHRPRAAWIRSTR